MRSAGRRHRRAGGYGSAAPGMLAAPAARRALAAPLALYTLLLFGATPAAAQAPHAGPVFGDPSIPPPGVLRVRLAPVVTTYDSRFARGTGCPQTGRYAGRCFEDGRPEPLAVDFNTVLGPDRFPALTRLLEVDAALERVGVAARPDPEDAVLGSLELDLRARRTRVPLRLDLGVTGRVSVGARVPLVRTRTDAAAAFTGGGAVGLTMSAFGGEPDAFAAGLAQAAAALDAAADELAGTGDPAAARARELADGLDAYHVLFFGDADSPGLADGPFLFTAGSDVGSALLSRLAAIRSDAAAFDVVVPELALPGPPDTEQFQAFLAGDFMGASALAGHDGGWRLGDVELAATFQYAGTTPAGPPDARPGTGWYGSVTGVLRLPTGTVDSPHDFVDLGTGDDQLDAELVLRNGFTPHPRLRIGLIMRYAHQFSHELVRRVTPADRPLAPAMTLSTVERTPGDYAGLALAPSLRIGEGVAATARYAFFRKGQDAYRRVDAGDAPGRRVPELERETDARFHRVGFGIRYAPRLQRAEMDGAATVPAEFSIRYAQTVAGAGGRLPDAAVVTVSVRFARRLWGTE